MKRAFYLIGNWKMNKSSGEAKEFFATFSNQIQKLQVKNRVGIAPPFTSLHAASLGNTGGAVWLGAQNMGLKESGAHTGEVAPSMLKEHGVEFVILGHSERRHIYRESSGMVADKVLLALQSGLTPIVCVGETEKERHDGNTMQVIRSELEPALKGVAEQDLEKIIIAYEPLWAVGTGKVATPEEVSLVHRQCRDFLTQVLGEGVGEKISILYGGSVNSSNVESLASASDVDGFLVGGASLKIEDFVSLVNLTKDKLL